ncbi:hypothetical protein CI109_104048 [Kwoniella shandongensis]|uniref:Sfi1 spindle body domain-containing protein n=1 Tax=Kwoniella shandongensis TaxID=1734106 RepID=A0A5M6BXE1_9TREE|nr:uncharacterized protein CI109_004066 [Kwoniella shandongensis]KAA5527527.1 hypothetical protein CI109_004066 [Kwoniella shandongensis]
MLASSTSSGSKSASGYTDSTALSSTVDLEIVQSIFDRGKYATSFPQIFRPYTEVLQENGISPTGDSAYYNFLLKVGVIKAPTWGDKWDIWKATRSPNPNLLSSSSSRSPPSSFLDDTSRARSAQARARVPFLASASSDLDEGFAPEEDGGANIEEASLIHTTRPSPRKEIGRKKWKKDDSQSFVGYNSPDFDSDLLSFDPPIRTSTPVSAHHHHHHHHHHHATTPKYADHPTETWAGTGFPPPAYSVSNVSQGLEETTAEFSALGLVTPRAARGRSRSRSRSPIAVSTWVDRIDDLPLDIRREMEEKADTFYRYDLMGRCWNMWFKTSEWYRITYKNIPIARDNLLLRQILEKWWRSTRQQLALPATAEQHHQRHLKSLVLQTWIDRLKEKELAAIEARLQERQLRKRQEQTFETWQSKWENRRTERWKKDMAERELRFVENRENVVFRKALIHWQVEARSRMIDSTKKLHILESTFYGWYEVAMKMRHLSGLLKEVEQRKLAEAFEFWRKRSELSPIESEVRGRHEGDLMRRVWSDWRISRWQHQQSSTFSRRRLLLSAVDKWKAAFNGKKSLERQAERFDRLRLMRGTLKTWQVSSRGQMLLQIRERRIKTRAMSTWKSKLAGIQDHEAVAEQFNHNVLSNRLYTAFHHWRSRHGTIKTQFLRADLVREEKLLSRSFTTWCDSARTIRANQVAADKAHAFFLLQTALKTWKITLAQRRAQEYLFRKEREAVRPVFERWRVLTRRYADLKRREAVFRIYSDKQTLKNLLAKWTERVIEVKDRELKTSRARDIHVLKDALSKWHLRTAQIKAYEKKADDSIEIRENENLRRMFRSWRARAKRSKRLRVLADIAAVRRKEKLIRDVFDKWYERKRERDLEEIENEVAFLHENVILYGVMDKWKALTDILPGISADAKRIKYRTMKIWLDALSRKKRADEMARERDHKLLSEAFKLWRDTTTQKVARNARRTRGRTRPSLTSQANASRRSSLNVSSSSSSARPVQSQEQTRARRITPLAQHIRTNSHSTPRHSLPLSPRLGSEERILGVTSSETEVSEPVYSRLRSELGRRRGGGSEEPQEVETQRRMSGGGMAGDGVEGDARPRSTSEMFRALRGTMPGR